MSDQESAGKGDRDANGKFLPGHSVKSPGRPPGRPDFRRIVEETCESLGLTIDRALAKVFQDLMKSAGNGDVQAQKFLVERLCGKDADQLEITHAGEIKRTDQTAEERIKSAKDAVELILEARGKRDGE